MPKSMNFVCMLTILQGLELNMLTGLKTNGTSGLANLQYHEFFRKRRNDFRLRLMHRKQKCIKEKVNNNISRVHVLPLHKCTILHYSLSARFQTLSPKVCI